MTTFSPYPAYILGTACFGRGLMAIASPRDEYSHLGLPLESSIQGTVTAVSPLMYFKGLRELSYGATMIALQRRGHVDALTTFAAVLSLVRIGDGVVVWLKGGGEI